MISGTIHTKYLGGWDGVRGLPCYLWAVIIFGSVFPDLDHFAALLTGNQELWGVLHQPAPVFVVGCIFVASVAGCFATLVLKSKRSVL